MDNIRLRVLGYQEGDEWVALALEMDLRGYGEKFEDALDELQGLIRMQISFAMERGNTDMIFKDAEPRYFKMYNREKHDALSELVGKTTPRRAGSSSVRDVPVPHIRKSRNKNQKFELACAPA